MKQILENELHLVSGGTALTERDIQTEQDLINLDNLIDFPHFTQPPCPEGYICIPDCRLGPC